MEATSMVAIKGHFDGKVFVPDEPVDLPRGQAVVLHVHPTPIRAGAAPAPPSPDKNAWEVLREMAGTIEGPRDWAAQHDHYLYGTPKRPENDK
jgi:hypothetical protein